jgi:energy-coupling factor transporter ATP-binding protein EcfA2
VTDREESGGDREEPEAACIAAAGYGFRYHASQAPQLRSLRFAVASGERVAIMGATGAGKTTLAMSFNGLVPHHREGEVTGTLTVRGQSVEASAITGLVRSVGLVMQDAESQITGLTVLDDATVGPANFGLAKTEVLARARAALRDVGLQDLEDRRTAHLSGGQRQRLAIAGILAMRPRIVVLDEPTSELDPAGSKQVVSAIRALEEGDGERTVLLIAHEPELVVDWADRLLVLSEGRLVYDGTPARFFTDVKRVHDAGLRPPGVTTAVAALRERRLIPAGNLPVTLDEATALLRPHAPLPPRSRPRQCESPVTRSPVVVRATDLTHRYPSGVEALSGVSVDIHEGEFVALLGGNGAGKTTFARHLDGLLRPSSGWVEVNGRSTAGRPVHVLAAEVGYVFQNPDHQIFASTVFDEIAFGLRNQGRSAQDIAERVGDVADRVGLAGFMESHPFRLGRGQRQRLAIASVLALEPSILVVDEPTTGQDWSGALAMMDLTRTLNEAGHTILVVTHDMALASRYATRALVFDRGRIVADSGIADLFSDEGLLRRTGLEAPQITRLARRIGLPPVVTTEQFVAAWMEAR